MYMGRIGIFPRERISSFKRPENDWTAFNLAVIVRSTHVNDINCSRGKINQRRVRARDSFASTQFCLAKREREREREQNPVHAR